MAAIYYCKQKLNEKTAKSLWYQLYLMEEDIQNYSPMVIVGHPVVFKYHSSE